MGYTCQTTLKHTNSVQMAENATTHSCTHLQYAWRKKNLIKRVKPNRGKDGRFYIFHSAEGCRRYNEPQRAPNFMY